MKAFPAKGREDRARDHAVLGSPKPALKQRLNLLHNSNFGKVLQPRRHFHPVSPPPFSLTYSRRRELSDSSRRTPLGATFPLIGGPKGTAEHRVVG
jgi:hypothetical protein